MERPTPHFLSHEQRERIDFYRDWVRTSLIEGVSGTDDLLAYRNRVSLDKHERRQLRQLDIDTEPFDRARQLVDERIAEQINGAVKDINRVVFEPGLFRVGIVADQQTYVVERLAVADECVVPVVDGEVYTGDIDDVVFDR